MSAHVEIIGQGQPLVMLHGWGMHSGVWQPLIKKLSAQYMLYLVDLPGMGNSRPIEPYHLHALADEVAQVIPGVSDVLGWSLGGLIAQRIALNQPDRIRRLILVGSTPCFVNKADWDAGIDSANFESFAAAVNSDYKATILQFLTLQCMKADDARSTLKQLRASFETRPTPTQTTLQRALQILLESDLRAEVSNIRKPTLLIHGDRDTLAPVQAAHWMMQQLPHGFLRVMSGSAHAPFLSHSEQFIAALNQFLEP
ncbi:MULTISPECIES: pimeloyl-ACP methyl ester esterase BioH [Methylotenera]|uniref:pimeloyl-ACP methyl ester esterase BioH n=1 Tax=Methylotenera TaxID=359407 RepID=UPI00036377FA|nr:MULTISPECIES: pimeloyl-ACP methyl ester esterase BioH [Methylotenera]